MAAQQISIQRAKTRGNAPAAEGGSRRALRLHGKWLHETFRTDAEKARHEFWRTGPPPRVTR